MKWIKINIDNIPKGEVLAANFKKGTYGYKEKVLGYLSLDVNVVVCGGCEVLENCTHYINIHKDDIA